MPDWSNIQAGMKAEYEAFRKALRQPRASQFEQLQAILANNRDCGYGRRHGFGSISSESEYRQRVPIVDYEKLAPMIEAMYQGETGLLCQQPLACFELTGGSSAGPRKIPYTEDSLAAMQRALYPWLMDLSTGRPGICRGSSYWSISPAMRAQASSPGGVPIGMPNDAVYFGPEVAAELEKLLAVPMTLAACQDLDAWRYLTLRYLIEQRNLSLISVWSPSFILDLLRYLDENLSRFIDDIAQGKPGIAAAAMPSSIPAVEFAANPALARHLRAAAHSGKVRAERLWPQLDTLSCWTDASAQLFVAELRERFPGVNLQGKGLLATEGFISLPLTGAVSPVLALRSGFYEFEDDAGCIQLCSELTPGQSYAVILTNHAGLYRYRLGDRVRCDGFFEATPMLRFIGRAGLVSDLCGEKLSEDFVLKHLGAARGFTMLLASLQPRRGYWLILDAALWTAAEADTYAARVDRDLQLNPQYRHARSIRQLAAIRPLRVQSPWRRYAEHSHQNARLQGDIKPPVLGLDPALLFCFTARQADTAGVGA